MFFWVWSALSAEISLSKNIPFYSKVSLTLIEKYQVLHAVRSDAKAIHAKLIAIFPRIVDELNS